MNYSAVIVLALFFMCSAQAQCPSVCPAIYQPTCGFNGRCYKQFSNACQMNVANCQNRANFRQVGLTRCSGSGSKKC
ncbi:U-Kazal-Dg21.2-like [Calliphora vicina]|uniref:U-Kazal-Dg21.2-like n=1 Tax=Calliphora vicina TaxID=7373 RepID=UPI00325BBABA